MAREKAVQKLKQRVPLHVTLLQNDRSARHEEQEMARSVGAGEAEAKMKRASISNAVKYGGGGHVVGVIGLKRKEGERLTIYGAGEAPSL